MAGFTARCVDRYAMLTVDAGGAIGGRFPIPGSRLPGVFTVELAR